ncbi:MAG: hypothetical protein GEV10_25610 [Streptosporangiales bacterium]|nr:hypothetical protein [Streptosporangiales bacterium]
MIRSPRSGISMVMVLLVATVASCMGDPREQPATLPPVTAVTRTPSTATPTVADDAAAENAVRAVYLDFLANRNRTTRIPPDRVHREVARWLTDPELSKSLDSLAAARKQHLRNSGLIKPDIMSITVDGATARLEDCMDKSATYLVDSRTGRRIAGSAGSADVWAVSDFKKTAEGWRISSTSSKYKSCVDR